VASIWRNAGPVFAVAKDAAARMTARHPDAQGSRNDALIAIVFSAAALETFINEAAGLAEQAFAGGSGDRIIEEHPSVDQFAKRCAKIESEQGSTARKFQAASTSFTEKTYPEKADPFCDFLLLMSVRNGIMHGKDEDPTIYLNMSTEPPQIARQLRARGVVLGIEPALDSEHLAIGPYVAWLEHRDVARWACNSAVAIVQSFLKMVPLPVRPNVDPQYADQGSYRDKLHRFYADQFTPLPRGSQGRAAPNS
jgi:hypothetical protein